MLWNAAQDYSGRKRMQRRNEQENKKGEEKEIRDCIEASLSAWLNLNTVFLTIV
jgi:ribonuclease PH